LLKFGKLRHLAKPLALLLAGLPFPESDAVVPVPLHIDGLREREFNQTALIAKHLAADLHIPLRIDILAKNKTTPLQVRVDRKAHLKNLRGAFSANSSVQGLRVLLVDDVMTTGATVRECAAVQKKAGTAAVNVVVLARSAQKL